MISWDDSEIRPVELPEGSVRMTEIYIVTYMDAEGSSGVSMSVSSGSTFEVLGVMETAKVQYIGEKRQT